jgi:hypothetical protein
MSSNLELSKFSIFLGRKIHDISALFYAHVIRG